MFIRLFRFGMMFSGGEDVFFGVTELLPRCWFFEHVHAAPHGAELADESNRRNGDLLERATRRYLGVLALVLAEADDAGEIDLAAQGMTPLLAAGYLALSADGLAGPSGRPPTPREYRQRLRTLARVSVQGFGGTS